MTTYLLKPGELTLKSGNREEFENYLKRNLSAMLRGTHAVMNASRSRFFVHCDDDQRPAVENVLDRLVGITGYAQAGTVEKTVRAVLAGCVAEGRALAAQGVRSFKIEARRADKDFPLDSYGIMREAGAAVLAAVPALSVDVRHPERVIEVEIREKAYIYGAERPGLRGLPVGSAGRGLVLLSGGIDSPVAAYLMARRGLRLEAVHFHAHPYTSPESVQKTIQLAAIVGGYALGIRLSIVPFTQVQLRIREQGPQDWGTILLRMAMVDCATRLARIRKTRCLISGESLSQVASQTVENLNCTGQMANIPLLRPLIGIDKEETIRIARQIGTYETSILPYADCCVLFSPAHPVIRGEASQALLLYQKLNLNELIEEALRERSTERCGFPPEKPHRNGKEPGT